MFVVLLAAVLVAQMIPVAYCQASHQVEFYIFGSMGCPYCRDLKERLTGSYGEGAVIFREVDEPENGERLAALYSMIYPEMRDMGIPLTIIVIDGEPAGSVIGGMPDDFWRDMIDECLRTGKFLVFDGQALYIAEKDQSVMRRISEIIGLTPSANVSSAAPSTVASDTAQTLPASAMSTALTKNLTRLEWACAEAPVKVESAQLTNYGFMIAAAVLLAAMLTLQLRRRRQ